MAVVTLHSASYPAVPAAVSDARHAVERAAAAAGVAADVVSRVAIAVSEAATNAVVHAYADRPPGTLSVAAVLDGQLIVTVADDGPGVRPRADSPGIGLGLALIGRLSDGLSIDDRPTGGALVTMRFQV